jgi:hypothetical protein
MASALLSAGRRVISDEVLPRPLIIDPQTAPAALRAVHGPSNLARRQLTTEQKRQLVADQLRETPGRSNRRISKQLGVSHPTVASVWAEMEATGQVFQFERTVGSDGKAPPANRQPPVVHRPSAAREARREATTLLRSDCRRELRKGGSICIDTFLTDPPYPEVDREYGRITAKAWQALMREVMAEARRILKPSGSMVVVLQPNYEQVGRMRLWLWEFVPWAGREWNLVQDHWMWAIGAMPLTGTSRKDGLLRQSVKMCVWLGPAAGYRNQGAVLCSPSDALFATHRSDDARRKTAAGRT